ncbi:acyl-CoA reductase [Chryseobacterium sp.]|uniref:acyl-CoA reductase n=1 Tax=Chryseobacterium sp. TaxID=1871047 RepID=UPI00289B875D|nr:acyl-CoA reductase [Chryseobacterium sp.]
MNVEQRVLELVKLSEFIKAFLAKNPENFNENDLEFDQILRKSEIENPWFTQESQILALEQWVSVLNESQIKQWINQYSENETQKRVGLILAGNIPLVGFHDVISVIFSNHIPVIKLSSKDRLMLSFLLKKWKEFSNGDLQYEIVEKLENFDAVIATGSNNTARYLEYYFKNSASIIRKNRTSVAVISGNETDEELQLLATDIFQYYGLGCRNVTRLFIPEDFVIDRLFESFVGYKEIINHNKYANNYDYNRAVYLLNQELFWDNNFVMLKEDEKLFSPLSVINFSRYENLDEVKQFIAENEENIQCVVSQIDGFENSVKMGEAQNPGLDTYADNIDTMKFLSEI